MSHDNLDPNSSPDVEVPINYLLKTSKTPVFHQSDTAADIQSAEGTRKACPMRIQDARLIPNKFSLDVHGFTFENHQSLVTDFHDNFQLKSVYEPELEKLLTKLTGCGEIVIFDHTHRSSSADNRLNHNSRPPVAAPHADYTDTSAHERLRDVMGDVAKEKQKNRFAIINIWRSINGTIEEWPLAVCDSRTVDDTLMIATLRHAPHREEPSFEYSRQSETNHACYDSNHSWFYFSKMTQNEILIFKNYDTIRDGKTARYSLHTSFEDPTSPVNPSPRETIESRVILFFE
jgi:hypothetical protein